MTFKTPSLNVYFFSLLIAATLAAIAYWILQSQNLINNGVITLITGLLIGHTIAVFSQPASNKQKTKAATKTANNASGETLSLYVGNLAYRAQRDELQDLFANYGNVNSVRIMIDRATRRPRGYAFVEMDSNAAHEAIKHLDNTEFYGRTLRVSEAKQKQ